MDQGRNDWRSLGWSIALHLLLVGVIAVGYLKFTSPKPAQQRLAIEATVVTTVPARARPIAPPDPLPIDEVQEPEQEKIREQIERQAARVAEQRRVAAEQKEVQRQAQAENEKRRAEQEKVAKQKALEARERTQRESELRAQIATEERVAAAQASGEMAQYIGQITARIERAWIRPASVQAGLVCEVRVTQVPGGAVVGVQVGKCNGNESVRQSLEAAAYRASPLPQPSNPALFDRNLTVTFAPTD